MTHYADEHEFNAPVKQKRREAGWEPQWTPLTEAEKDRLYGRKQHVDKPATVSLVTTEANRKALPDDNDKTESDTVDHAGSGSRRPPDGPDDTDGSGS